MKIYEAVEEATKENKFIIRKGSAGDLMLIKATNTYEHCIGINPDGTFKLGNWKPTIGDLIADDWITFSVPVSMVE